MNSHWILVAAAFALSALSLASERGKETWDAKPKPLKGDYQRYGGTLSEMQPPNRKDSKVAFMFTGPLAKELFDQIGPDAKLSCSDAQDYRERNRGDLSCTHTNDYGYACYLGISVITGKSIRGSIC